MTNIVLKFYGKKKLKTKSIFEKLFFGSKYYFEVYIDITVTLSNGEIITIPKGFLTDFASVPSYLVSVLPNIDDALLAYIVHDYLYVTKYSSRKFADNEFLKMMNSLQGNKLSNKIKYLGVIMFGGLIY